MMLGVNTPVLRLIVVMHSYNATVWGPSGNMTVNGTLTYGNNFGPASSLARRGIGAGNLTDVDLNYPPYAIHNGFGRLAEQYGLPDVARKYYKRVPAPKSQDGEPMSTHALASRRLAALGDEKKSRGRAAL